MKMDNLECGCQYMPYAGVKALKEENKRLRDIIAEIERVLDVEN
jgi:hypothetical protein